MYYALEPYHTCSQACANVHFHTLAPPSMPNYLITRKPLDNQ